MASVGIRELRQHASELLRRVEDGERIEITDRGRPVAVLAPLPDDPLERLRASGDLQDSDGDLSDLPEPLALPAGAERPSSVLDRLRRDER
jgi:prevent-host-death family protein